VHDARAGSGAPAGVDPDRVRWALRVLVSPVTVITTMLDGRPWGLTVSAFTPVCLDPPTVLVCVNRDTATAGCIANDGRFGVNVLDEHQASLARRCASPGAPKFLRSDELLAADDVASRVPIIREALISFECAAERIEVGTHVVVLGRVLAVFTVSSNGSSNVSSNGPLLYGNGHYQRAERFDSVC